MNDTLPPRTLEAEGGPCRDCGICRHFHAGHVVIRGSTVGWCSAFNATITADATCDAWQQRSIPVLAFGEHG